jgi:hypothetical protein
LSNWKAWVQRLSGLTKRGEKCKCFYERVPWLRKRIFTLERISIIDLNHYWIIFLGLKFLSVNFSFWKIFEGSKFEMKGHKIIAKNPFFGFTKFLQYIFFLYYPYFLNITSIKGIKMTGTQEKKVANSMTCSQFWQYLGAVMVALPTYLLCLLWLGR